METKTDFTSTPQIIHNKPQQIITICRLLHIKPKVVPQITNHKPTQNTTHHSESQKNRKSMQTTNLHKSQITTHHSESQKTRK